MRMSDFDLALQEITAIMQDEPSPQDLREMQLAHLSQQIQAMPVQDLLDIILTGVSEVCARATTCPQDLEPHEPKLGRVLSFAEMALSFLDAHKPPEKRRKPNPTYWPRANVVGFRR